MIVNSLTKSEVERLKILQSYQILDTETEKDFDGIVELAAQMCGTPIAIIAFVDENRQWYKSKKGIDVSETERSVSFCTYTIEGNDILMVKDASKDARFATNPFVEGDLHLRFYAGMPLITSSGHKLGTICVFDREPKDLRAEQLMDLRILAKQVVNLLDLRLKNMQMKNLLQNKSTELSSVFDRIGEAFISLDKNWNYTYANKQMGKLVHRDSAALIGKNLWEEFPDAVGSTTYHAYHEAMREQKYICHVDYFEPLDLWQENHIYPSSEGISVFIRDISERKKAEIKLIESLETLERAEEQAKMGSWSLEVDTGKRTWSKQLFLMFGFEPRQEAPEFDEFLNRIHPEDRSEVIMSVEKMWQGIEPGEFIIRTNPAILPLRYLLRYTRKVNNRSGKTISFEGTMLDITELQKTNSELDHFVYSVSHDFRAPIATILGLINIAELEHPNAAMSSYFKTIRDHVNRLDGFIKDILNYSLNARTEISKEKIDFYSLVEDVKERIEMFAKTERLKIELEIQNAAEFYSDRLRLGIILNNLLSNSIKYQDFTKDSCSVKIQISFMDNHIEMIYSDNGIGIEESHLGKIFNMFYRASPNSKGSGLGLYIVKEAVSKLGGTISAQSSYGKSTTFKLILPIKIKE